MSWLYDPRSKRPHPWTYLSFIFITLGLLYAFYSYGQRKAAERLQPDVNAETTANF